MAVVNPIIRIDGISKSFDGTQALKSVSLEVSEGEFLSLLGPSGCGKTTLLRIVAGLEHPDAGRVLLQDADITEVTAHRRPLNLVFQRVTLFPHLDVFENVAFGLTLRRVPKADITTRVRRVLQLVRLPGFERRDVTTLSGGEAQRIALARALVNEPKVLLLDEPLGALDLQIRRELQIELKDIHRELGSTFVFVTHDQEEALSMSDRVVLMSEGKIVQVGTPVEVYRNPASVFAASFVGSSNLWQGEVVEIRPEHAVIDLGGRRIRARPRPEARSGERVWVLVRPESLTLTRAVGDQPRADGTTMRGRVADVRFIGSVVHYRIDVGQRLITATRLPEDGQILAEGEEVAVSWDAAEALLLKE
jgi:spermidine/putrescine transport system ATP-binding protein